MQRVLQMLETRDSVHVAELAQTFSVSAVTVRNDLSQLARQGLVARVRGGVRPLQRGESELGFDLRLRVEVDRKKAIARARTVALVAAAQKFHERGLSVIVSADQVDRAFLADPPAEGVAILESAGVDVSTV